MPISAINLYMERLRKQRAKMKIVLSEVISVPHMTEESRREWHRELHDLLNDKKNIVRPASLADLERIGIGVKRKNG